MAQPTRISGQHDTGDGGTGAVTAGVFVSPTISFETEALGQQVFVDATFTQVASASGTGIIDAEGNVSFRTDLTVDLHLEVGNPATLVQDCRTTPVGISLNSVDPYDPDTGRVTVRDPNFTVPPVPEDGNRCIGLVADNVNALLAGSGHALTMTLEGDVELPPPAGCPTTTALAVAPAGSYLGDEVTLTATVAPAPDGSPECADAAGVDPVGSVEFLAGTESIAVAPLGTDGEAVLVTDDIPAGPQQLVARFRAAPPYSASRSEPVAHRVAVRPLAVIDAPLSIPIGGAPREVAVEITNTGLGTAAANARLDLTLTYGVGAPPSNLTVERFDGTNWVAVTMATAGARKYAAVMPSTGVPLAVGASSTQRIRFTVGAGTRPGMVSLVFDLVVVDPGTGLPAPVPTPAAGRVATAEARTAFVSDAPATTTPNILAFPHTLRQGMSGGVNAQVPSVDSSPAPTGTLELLLDGQVLPIRLGRTNPGAVGYQPALAIDPMNQTLAFVLPSDTRTGTRELTVRYSGDAFYRPAVASTTITVLPARGPSYTCVNQNAAFTEGFVVNVAGTALLPAAAKAGQPIGLDQLDIEMVVDRGIGSTGFASLLPPETPVVEPGSGQDGFEVVDLGFGELGSGTATAVRAENTNAMNDATRPVDPAPDSLITFAGLSAELTPAGAPGEVVDVDLDSLDLVLSFFGGQFLLTISCAPVGEPLSLGQVVIAGTTLTVEASDPARQGRPVTLRAAVAPVGVAGTVEFRDGTSTLTVTPVRADGTASFTTRDLALGSHQLRAVFRSHSMVTSSESAPFGLNVLPAQDCAAFAQDGNAAVVRLVYIELLGRCPDQAGFDYWTGRLDAGTTPATFARTISATPEAVGLVVDDAYLTMLGRRADAPGKAFWVERMRTGNGRYDQLLADLGASPEFWTRSGASDAGFVNRVYQRLLNRTPDQSGQDFWVGRLQAGTSPRVMIFQLANLDEPLGVLVADSYDEILSRKPTNPERADGIVFLRRTGDRSGLYAQLIGTNEFTTRAQTFPNPED